MHGQTHVTDLQPCSHQKDELISMFKNNCQGLGFVGQPVHFTLNPKVNPGTLGRAVTKPTKAQAKLYYIVNSGDWKKDQPTRRGSNMIVQGLHQWNHQRAALSGPKPDLEQCHYHFTLPDTHHAGLYCQD